VTDVGDWRIPSLTVAPFDGTTEATLQIEAPNGTTADQTPTSADDVPQAGTQTWTGQGYELTAPGEWIERWTVTGTGASKARRLLLVAPDPAAVPSGTRVYATTADYATHLRAAPPTGARRALAEASRDIDDMLLTAVYAVDEDGLPTDAAVAAALRDATVIQADYRHGLGDAFGRDAGRLVAGRIGSVSVTRSGTPGGQGTPPRHAPKAWQALQQAGLVGYGPMVW
jgi:3D (Asp-Asp-Asp) domain-containing protein